MNTSREASPKSQENQLALLRQRHRLFPAHPQSKTLRLSSHTELPLEWSPIPGWRSLHRVAYRAALTYMFGAAALTLSATLWAGAARRFGPYPEILLVCQLLACGLYLTQSFKDWSSALPTKPIYRLIGVDTGSIYFLTKDSSIDYNFSDIRDCEWSQILPTIRLTLTSERTVTIGLFGYSRQQRAQMQASVEKILGWTREQRSSLAESCSDRAALPNNQEVE
jgi:hypothetical protein